MKYQQILTVSIEGESLSFRAPIVGWSEEFGNIDIDKVISNPNIHVGMIRGTNFLNPLPKTVAHALRLGWKYQHHTPYSESNQASLVPCQEIILVREVDMYGNPI